MDVVSKSYINRCLVVCLVVAAAVVVVVVVGISKFAN